MLENQQLRSLIDNMETVNREQAETIKLLCQQDTLQQSELARYRETLAQERSQRNSRQGSLQGSVASTPSREHFTHEQSQSVGSGSANVNNSLSQLEPLGASVASQLAVKEAPG